MGVNDLENLLQHWGVKASGFFPDAYIAGSPERTLQRTVVLDSSKRAFILEEVPPQSAGRKREIAAILMSLSISGLVQVHPHLPDLRGSMITLWKDRYWQLRPYVAGELLPRPEYLEDAWRGQALADFLVNLHRAALKTEYTFPAESFSIVHFIESFAEKLAGHDPEIRHQLKAVLDYLSAEFFPIHDTLPRSFCHGDYHPLNVVWSEDAILSVIDWEFCGTKPEGYDLALLIGCIGVEDPQALTGPLVRSLLRRIRETGIYAEPSWSTLPELVMAIRFAWLSEWLRKKDTEMVRLELDYQHLLLVNRAALASAWRSF